MATIFKRSGKGPYVIQYFDHTGQRGSIRPVPPDRHAAERIASKLEADVALRRDGVVDPTEDRFSARDRRPLADHVTDYLGYCRGSWPSKEQHRREDAASGTAPAGGTGATRLTELTADTLSSNMAQMRDHDYSARTVNFRRQTAVAFMNWCVKHRRVRANPLTVVDKLNESEDRRRVRRPLTNAELDRLLAVAESRGRGLVSGSSPGRPPPR